MSDWNAAQYHRLSEPQRGWGLRVLERLQPRDGERILDIGCGTGRLTAEIRRRAPGASVVGMDRSWTMLEQAHAHFTGAAAFVQGDGAALPFADGSVDAVFSTATFHWVLDHDRLFAEIHRVLKPGGRLVSQCGGGPNLRRLYARAARFRASEKYREYFSGWQDPWHYASPEETQTRLARVGFRNIHVSDEPAPTPFSSVEAYGEFITTVCMRHHMDRLPPPLRASFIRELALEAADDDPPLTLDYWRLNADATR